MSQLFSIKLEKSGEVASTNHFFRTKWNIFRIGRKNVGIQHRDNPEAVGHLLISSLENPVSLAICEGFYKCHVPVVTSGSWESGCPSVAASVWAGTPTGLSSEQHTKGTVPLSEPRGYSGFSSPALFTAGSLKIVGSILVGATYPSLKVRLQTNHSLNAFACRWPWCQTLGWQQAWKYSCWEL